MKKFLPKGFTLIELMVVIAIIAILALVAITFFTSAQKSARDARRRTDIDSIANALETGKTPGATTFGTLATTSFASGTIPTDPGNNGSATYCIATTTASGANPPATPSAWVNTSACGTVTSATYNAVAAGTQPANGSVAWTVCALLENGIGNPAVYCRNSATQ